MKNVTIGHEITTNLRWSRDVKRANEMLETELGRSAGSVSASWQLMQTPDRPLIRLEIWDWSGRVGTSFVPEELVMAEKIRPRLIRLWGDLLEIRSHKQLEDIEASSPLSEGK